MVDVVRTLEALLESERSLKGAHKPAPTQRSRAPTRVGAAQTARPFDENVDGNITSGELLENEDDGHQENEKESKSRIMRLKKSREGSDASPPKENQKNLTWAASRQDVREAYLEEKDDDTSRPEDPDGGYRGGLAKKKGKEKLAPYTKLA
jgi:hypothetical protein